MVETLEQSSDVWIPDRADSLADTGADFRLTSPIRYMSPMKPFMLGVFIGVVLAYYLYQLIVG